MRSVKIKEVIDALEQFAPLPLQEDYDNAGLQIGLTETDVSGALLCLDVTEAVLEEARREGCNLVVAHHPLIFHKLARLADEDMVQRIVRKAIESGIAIVAMHTNIDAVQGGVNHKIAEKLGLQDLRMIGREKRAGDKCGADGIVGRLPQSMSATDFVDMLKTRFAVESVQANELLRREISRVAVCGGAGAFLLDDAVRAGADAFLTGEMHYHEFFGHEQEIQICVIGHYQSEQFTPELFRAIIEAGCQGVRCVMSKINTNPIVYL